MSRDPLPGHRFSSKMGQQNPPGIWGLEVKKVSPLLSFVFLRANGNHVLQVAEVERALICREKSREKKLPLDRHSEMDEESTFWVCFYASPFLACVSALDTQ